MVCGISSYHAEGKGRRIRLHDATYYMKLGPGWWLVLIVESEVRGMVRWGESLRSDERCEDERTRQPVLRTPGNSHFGTRPASVKV